MKMGRWPTDSVMPAIGARRSRISFSSSCCERRLCVLMSVSFRFTSAVLRPSGVPILATRLSISGNSFSAVSIWRTLLSVYSRLEPTGVLKRRLTQPWSVSGNISPPIIGTSIRLPANRAKAVASVVLRQRSATFNTLPYQTCRRSMPVSIQAMKRPSHGTYLKRSLTGSRQTDDSMGSSVKLTNRETSTATATVMPNCRKKRPMMPSMKATGTNTATMANVVAITARPISLVPSLAAW